MTQVLNIETLPKSALLSSKQLASVMGVSLITLSRWRSDGKGPPFVRLSATKVGYPIGGYLAWLSQNTIG